MTGILFVDRSQVEATSGRMLITFSSGGDDFRFHLPPHVAIKLRQHIMRDGWEVLCVPDAEVVHLKPKGRRSKEPKDRARH